MLLAAIIPGMRRGSDSGDQCRMSQWSLYHTDSLKPALHFSTHKALKNMKNCLMRVF